jgi:hypothetical protein
MPIIPAMQASTNRRVTVQASLTIKQSPVSKITTIKGTGGMAQVVECMHSKHKALRSTASTTKIKHKLK